MKLRLIIPFLLLAACGDDTDGGNNDDTGNGGDDDTGETTEAPDWSGRWTVEIEWSVECDLSFGDTASNSGTDTWNLGFEGPADDLTVDVNGSEFFILRGQADDDGFSICGDFPMYDHEGEMVRSGTQNEICLEGTEVVSAEEVRGVARGPFEARFGADCELQDSPFTLTR
jgi:hypothetical protein